MSTIAFPYSVLDRNSVNCDSWTYFDKSQLPAKLENSLRGWDYLSKFQLRRKLSVDYAVAAEQLHIPIEELVLLVVVRVGTGAGRYPRLRKNMQNVVLTSSSPAIELNVEPDSKNCCSRLSVETLVLLAETPSQSHILSPEESGAILWTDEQEIDLGNPDDRFPMEAVSFSKYYRGLNFERALWYLCWYDKDLDRDIAGGVRLYLNTDNPEFLERIENADPSTLQTVIGDVMLQICNRFLEIGDNEDWYISASEFSMANQAKHWLDLAFPGVPYGKLKQRNAASPQLFSAALMSTAEIA